MEYVPVIPVLRHVRAAPVICQLITLLDTAGLCEESDDKGEDRETESEPCFI